MIVDSLKGQMDKLEELLPGIEQYLSHTLANEHLSRQAEDKRQYFLERLDILKLPPTRPPRPSVSRKSLSNEKPRSLSPDLLDELIEEPNTPVFTNHVPDFAAEQRELSRTLISQSDEIESDDDEEGKVYDDIGEEGSDQEHDEEKDELYEVPITNSMDNLSSVSAMVNDDPDNIDVEDGADATSPDAPKYPSPLKIEVANPPPLPPRHNRQGCEDHGSSSVRLSLTFPEPPELPVRPLLPPRSEIYALSERSDKSEKSDDKSEEKSGDQTDDPSDDTGTSYESYDEDGGAISQDSDLLTKLNIKLPMPLNRKKRKGFSKSQSSSQWDLHLSFKDLDDVSICGELHLHGKLTWSRRVVATTNRKLLCYKPEKTSKPALVVQLPGYQATYNERDNKKGFEILLHHPLAENYVFSVDLKDWAQSWCEYIQAAADGKPPPGRPLRLYRHSGSYLTDLMYKNKGDIRSASNASIASSEGGSEPGSAGSQARKDVSKARVFSFAHRASALLNLNKKRGLKKMTMIGIPAEILSEARPRPTTPGSSSSLERYSPGFPVCTGGQMSADMLDGRIIDNKITMDGYLNIFSTFNRRLIGKRWCLIRENTFECYRSERSNVCEMKFVLKDCVFCHAKEETKSEKGIMLLENGVEKITVEPLVFDDLDDWLSAFVRETSTQKVPEGLDKYYTEKEYEVPPEDLLDRSDDPDDPYSCIKDISFTSSFEESTMEEQNKTPEINAPDIDALKVAEMYSPVLWETKRTNSSRTSVSSERGNQSLSRFSISSDKPRAASSQTSEISEHVGSQQELTPEGQPIKYSSSTTDSGYTTASSPTSSNVLTPDDNDCTQQVPITSPGTVHDAPFQSWDIKKKISSLESQAKKSPSSKKTTPDSCVKSKIFSFEQKRKEKHPVLSSVPIPPKRKNSASKLSSNLSKELHSPRSLKPVSLNFILSGLRCNVSDTETVLQENSPVCTDTDTCLTLDSNAKDSGLNDQSTQANGLITSRSTESNSEEISRVSFHENFSDLLDFSKYTFQSTDSENEQAQPLNCSRTIFDSADAGNSRSKPVYSNETSSELPSSEINLSQPVNSSKIQLDPVDSCDDIGEPSNGASENIPDIHRRTRSNKNDEDVNIGKVCRESMRKLEPLTATAIHEEPVETDETCSVPLAFTAIQKEYVDSRETRLEPSTFVCTAMHKEPVDPPVTNSTPLTSTTIVKEPVDSQASSAIHKEPVDSRETSLDPCVSTAIHKEPFDSRETSLEPCVSTAIHKEPLDSHETSLEPCVFTAIRKEPVDSRETSLEPCVSTAIHKEPVDSRETSLEPCVSTTIRKEAALSRESSQEPTTSCSSWDSSPDSNFYNIGSGVGSDEASDDDLQKTLCAENGEIDENQRLSDVFVVAQNGDENCGNSEIKLLQRNALSSCTSETLNDEENLVDNHEDGFVQHSGDDTGDWLIKLDKLRRTLVDLKKRRIQARDNRLFCTDENELPHCEEEYDNLDLDCKQIGERISQIEGRIKLSGGTELQLHSEV